MNDIEALAQRIILIGKGRLLFDGSIDAIRHSFGTHKTLTVVYRHYPERLEIPGAELLSWSPERSVLRIDTAKTLISEVLLQLSKQVELLDVEMDTQPIEEMIVQLYKEHQI